MYCAICWYSQYVSCPYSHVHPSLATQKTLDSPSAPLHGAPSCVVPYLEAFMCGLLIAVLVPTIKNRTLFKVCSLGSRIAAQPHTVVGPLTLRHPEPEIDK